MTEGADLGETMIVDLAKVQGVVALLGGEAFLRFRPVLEARLAKLGALLMEGPAMTAQALWLTHQCHGSALAMGFTQLASAFEDLEAKLRSNAAGPGDDAVQQLAQLHAVAWSLIVEQIPALAAAQPSDICTA